MKIYYLSLRMRLISRPVLCHYYVTYRCNASCGFCDIWERPSPYITLDQAEDNMRDLKKLGVKVIDFTGGEPLLHQQLDKLLELAKRYGFITTVTTNCLLYPKWAQRLYRKVDMLHFSLDSIEENKHNASRNVDCYRFVMQSIKLAKSLGERPDILFTVSEDNIDELPLVHELCQSHRLVLILNPLFEYNEVNADSHFSDKALKKLSQWGKKKGVYLNEAFLALRKDRGNHVSDPVCKAASSSIVISPNNELVLPCYHLGIESQPIEGKLYSLYHSEKVQELVALEGRYPACEGCTINCYMQPSFAVEINKYWWKALPSTLKYNLEKGTWKKLSIGIKN